MRNPWIQKAFGRWSEPAEAKADPGTEVMPLTFETSRVRVVMIRGEPWWVLADVARVLGYRDASSASRCLLAHHKDTHRTCTPSGTQELIIVSESGLYRLIMRSNKPETERFQEWVTSEVLPSIRKTGRYEPTPIRAWIRKTAKRRGFSMGWQKKRQKVADGNKAVDSETFAMGGDAVACSMRYNSLYLGMFGMAARGLKKALGCRAKDSPLNQVGDVPLSTYDNANTALFHKMKSGVVPLESLQDEAKACGEHFHKATLEYLGPGNDFGIVEDPKGNKILDVVRQLPGSSS